MEQTEVHPGNKRTTHRDAWPMPHPNTHSAPAAANCCYQHEAIPEQRARPLCCVCRRTYHFPHERPMVRCRHVAARVYSQRRAVASSRCPRPRDSRGAHDAARFGCGGIHLAEPQRQRAGRGSNFVEQLLVGDPLDGLVVNGEQRIAHEARRVLLRRARFAWGERTRRTRRSGRRSRDTAGGGRDGTVYQMEGGVCILGMCTVAKAKEPHYHPWKAREQRARVRTDLMGGGGNS